VYKRKSERRKRRKGEWKSRDCQRGVCFPAGGKAANRLSSQEIRHGNQALHFRPSDLGSTDPRKIVALALHSRRTSPSLKGRWYRSQPLVPHLSLSLCKNRPLSVTMKASLTLAAALLLPVIVNAQTSNSTSVNVSGVCPTVPNLRLTVSPP
jgi:hypothetical protein